MDASGWHDALVREGRMLHIRSVPTRAAGATGLVVAPFFVGVCGTDLQILNGTRPDTAEILGHEGAGVVLDAGPQASMQVGDQVVFNPSAQLSVGKIMGHNVPGLFQRRVFVDEEAVADGLVLPVQTGLPPICGALVEPLAGVIYAHELIGRVVPEVGAVAVFGAGPIGLIVAAYFQQMGARVVVIHPSRRRIDTAVDLKLISADCAVVGSDDLAARVVAWNNGRRLDAALICTSVQGSSVALQNAVQMLRSGGCVEMITNYPTGSWAPGGTTAEAIRAVRAANICGNPAPGVYGAAEVDGRRVLFTGHRGTSREHLMAAMRVLRSDSSRYRKLVTHVLPLTDAAMAIQALADSRRTAISSRDCIKAVVDLRPLAAGCCSPESWS
jgi:2-epi-valiolone-7-phosphate 1-reductase